LGWRNFLSCPVPTSGTLSEAQHASHVCNNAWACAKAIIGEKWNIQIMWNYIDDTV